MDETKEPNGKPAPKPQPAPAKVPTPADFKAAIPGPVLKIDSPKEGVSVPILSNTPPVPAPDAAITAKQPRCEYVHAPDGVLAPCGGGGRLSPPFAETIQKNPSAFGALQCSVCGIRPVSQWSDGEEKFSFLWRGTQDPVGKAYKE